MTQSKIRLDFFDGAGWQEYPAIPHSQWQEAVISGDTNLGYINYVIHELEGQDASFSVVGQDFEQEQERSSEDLPKAISDRFPQSWWVEEVQSLDTRRGYSSWALAQQEQLDDVIADQMSGSRKKRMKP